MALAGRKPEWLTFDCYGTLVQWDEGLIGAMRQILAGKGRVDVDIAELIAIYDHIEHELEQSLPFRKFRPIVAESLSRAMSHFGVETSAADTEILTNGISAMPPFPETVNALLQLKEQGYKLCIVSNTEDAVIAGNVAQMGGAIDRVITAEQAQAYKPSPILFNHAHRELGVDNDTVLHICASPQLDLTAARALGFRCVWIDRNTGRQSPNGYVPNAILPNLAALPHMLKSLGW